MTTPSETIRPTLDLYNASTDRLRRSGMAAVGLWSLAAGFALQLATLTYNLWFFMHGPVTTINAIFSWIHLVGTVIICGGITLVAFAALGRENMRPWPRWSAAVILIAASNFGLFGYYLLNLLMHLSSTHGAAAPRTFTDLLLQLRWYYSLDAIASLMQAIGYALALCYTLQIASWRRSLFMALASAAALGLMILRQLADCTQEAIVAVELILDPTPHGFSTAVHFPRPVIYIHLFLSSLMVAYFIVLALSVRKMHAQPLAVPSPPRPSP